MSGFYLICASATRKNSALILKFGTKIVLASIRELTVLHFHSWRRRGRVVRVLDLRSCGPRSSPSPFHSLDLFWVISSSSPWLRSVNSSLLVSCRRGFLSNWLRLLLNTAHNVNYWVTSHCVCFFFIHYYYFTLMAPVSLTGADPRLRQVGVRRIVRGYALPRDFES